MNYEFYVSSAENAIEDMEAAFAELEFRLKQLWNFTKRDSEKGQKLDYKIQKINRIKKLLYRKYKKFISKEYPVFVDDVDENGEIVQMKVN